MTREELGDAVSRWHASTLEQAAYLVLVGFAVVVFIAGAPPTVDGLLLAAGKIVLFIAIATALLFGVTAAKTEVARRV